MNSIDEVVQAIASGRGRRRRRSPDGGCFDMIDRPRVTNRASARSVSVRLGGSTLSATRLAVGFAGDRLVDDAHRAFADLAPDLELGKQRLREAVGREGVEVGSRSRSPAGSTATPARPCRTD